jgi:hypothetical protein
MRVAAIMNDQDSGLVDTRMVTAHHVNTREIAGGCFCCRFSDLLEAAGELSTYQPKIIFAEPVGSCIDLSATIVQPLKAYHSASYRVAPITVLVDPDLATKMYGSSPDRDLEYLFRHQIEEADIVCTTKSDLHLAPAALPVPLDFSLSSKTGEGVELWLNEILHGGRIAGSQLLKIDYSRYAEAEAALGWLNVHAQIKLTVPASPAAFAGPLLDELAQSLTNSNIKITHLKVFDQTNSGFVKASICANGDPAQADGDLLADPERQHDLAINLRALDDPDHLNQIVVDALSRIDGIVQIRHQRSFRPAPPKPEYRFSCLA